MRADRALFAASFLVLFLEALSNSYYHRPRRRTIVGQRRQQHFPQQQYFPNVFQHHSVVPSPAQRQTYYRRSRQMLTPQGRFPQQNNHGFDRRRLHTIDNPHAIVAPHRDGSEEDQLRRIRLTLFLTQLQNQDGGRHQLILTDTKASEINYLNEEDSFEDEDYVGKKRRRKTGNAVLREKQSGGCPGRCTNMLSCVLQGGRALRKTPAQGCFGLMEICCASWRPAAAAQITQRRPRQRRRRRRKHRDRGGHGRALPHPLDSISYSSRPKKKRPVVHDSGEVSAESLLNLVEASSLEIPDIRQEEEQQTCGVSRVKNVADRRIMGGLDAGYGQFPWTAHVKIRGPGIDKECGGTLINRRWLLTAGHCTQYCVTVPLCAVEVPQHEITYKVILGEYDQLSTEYFPVDSYHAIDVIRHPLYRNAMRFRENGFLESEPRYDVAMLYLDRDVALAPNVAPICLPAQPFLEQAPGTLGTVVGWGRIGRSEDAPHSNVLQAATVPILSDEECLLETGLENFSDQMCAGLAGGESSACPGDSGGALQVQDSSGRWTIVGIVSNGPSVCGLQPVVFHKVANTLSWVHNVMERQGANKNIAAQP